MAAKLRTYGYIACFWTCPNCGCQQYDDCHGSEELDCIECEERVYVRSVFEKKPHDIPDPRAGSAVDSQ